MKYDKENKKYIDGESSLQEEQDLKQALQDNKAHSIPLIDFFNEEKKSQRNFELEKKLEALLEENDPTKRKLIILPWMKIAAIAILILSISGVFLINSSKNTNTHLAKAHLSQAEITLLQKSLQKLNKTIDYKRTTMELPEINYKEINKKKINENIYPFKIKPLKTGTDF